MSRHEQDREDLLAEATALVERAQLAIEGLEDPIVIGFRRDGCASIYCGSDPAWHFNTRRQLRRAYLAGMLYKAQTGRLIGLDRHRTSSEVQLVRHELSHEEELQVLARLHAFLSLLRARLSAGAYSVIGQFPAGVTFVDHLRGWLDELPASLEIAASPHAR